MKIVLAGSPTLVLPTFESIWQNHKIIAVITQPDQKKGRGMKWKATPVASWASNHKIRVFKPNKMIDIYDDLKALNFDLLITFAYGQMVPNKILKLGIFPPLNIHGSLLPKYRGAAPIHHALLNGEQELGISLIEMTKQMDAGPIYFQASQLIDNNTNYDQAQLVISHLAKSNINLWLQKIATNDVIPQAQPSNFSLAPKINKCQAQIFPTSTLAKAKCLIRAFSSVPGAFTFINNVRYKLFDYTNSALKGCLKIKLQDGFLFISDFQMAGKKRKRIATR